MGAVRKRDISKAFLNQVGLNVRKYRQKKKLTLEKLGLEIGLTRMQVNRIEKGYNITLETILKLALALNIKPEKLIKFEYPVNNEHLEGLVNTNKSNRQKPNNKK